MAVPLKGERNADREIVLRLLTSTAISYRGCLVLGILLGDTVADERILVVCKQSSRFVETCQSFDDTTVTKMIKMTNLLYNFWPDTLIIDAIQCILNEL